MFKRCQKVHLPTRQGCSLSPLLFTIFLELLAAMIREDSRIKGVAGGGREHKLFLYADDILLLSQDPTNSIKAFLEVMEVYSKVSGYCIHWHKSEAMPVSQTCSQNLHIRFEIVSKWHVYLGIELNSDIRVTMNTNMEKLLNKCKVHLDKWSKLRMTLWGKVNTIKMIVALQINDITGMIPVCIPQQLLLRYNNMVKHFLWDGRKPRINMDKLCQPKNRGGLSLPNIKYYSISFEMSKLVKHWKGLNTDLDWVLIEQELTSPFKPIEAQVTTNKEDNVMNPILVQKQFGEKYITNVKCPTILKDMHPYGTILKYKLIINPFTGHSGLNKVSGYWMIYLKRTFLFLMTD